MHAERPPYLGERIHCRERISFAAVSTAASCTRLFIRSTLARWQQTPDEDEVLLVASELVNNAVTATGVAGEHPLWTELDTLNLIEVHLLALDKAIVIEVWDASSELPTPRASEADAENGRGLLLIEALSSRWGSCPTQWGKVVWVEMVRPLRVRPHQRRVWRCKQRPTVSADAALLQCICVVWNGSWCASATFPGLAVGHRATRAERGLRLPARSRWALAPGRRWARAALERRSAKGDAS